MSAGPSAGGAANGRPSEAAASTPRANALRAFYGLAEEGDRAAASKVVPPSPSFAGAPASPESKTPASATSPDSSAFALPEALAAVLRDASSSDTAPREHAAALMHVQASLLREMRELDGARQSLVYNHHWQLVKGGETLRTMKARAEDLTPALDALQGSLSRADALRRELAAALPATTSVAPSE